MGEGQGEGFCMAIISKTITPTLSREYMGEGVIQGVIHPRSSAFIRG
jgi:hypothetical protein